MSSNIDLNEATSTESDDEACNGEVVKELKTIYSDVIDEWKKDVRTIKALKKENKSLKEIIAR